MRRYVSVWGMTKRSGFTLIEVMVSVMIISVVVLALLELQANNTYSFSHLRKVGNSLQYMSLLVGSSNYGFENENLTLDRLVDRFDIDDDLRRELKGIDVKVIYNTVEQIGLSEFESKENEENATQNDTSSISFEIGRTTFILKNGSASILRVRAE